MIRIPLRTGIIAVATFFLGCFLQSVWSEETSARFPDKRVVILHSYHQGFKWTDDIATGIRDGLKCYPGRLELIHEYMDSKRRWDDNYRMLLEALLHYKYRNMQPDAVIVSDNRAFEYMCDAGQQLFPGVPVFFCGVNYLDPQVIREHVNFTGISEAVDIDRNITLIQHLHPEARQIVFIVDDTETGKILAAHFEQLQARYASRLRLVQYTDYTFAELDKELQGLSSDSVVLWSIFFRDQDGAFSEFDEGARRVASASRVPVYCLWDFSLGYGPIGGYLTTGYEQGMAVAVKVMQSFAGMPTPGIPVRYEPVTQPVFDWQALQKYGVNTTRLPAGSRVIGRPESFYERFPGLLFAALVCMSVLFGVSLIHAWHVQQRVNILLAAAGHSVLPEQPSEPPEKIEPPVQDTPKPPPPPDDVP